MSNSNISPPEPVYAIVWSIQGEYDVPPPQAFSALGSCHTQGCYVGGVRRGSAHCLQHTCQTTKCTGWKSRTDSYCNNCVRSKFPKATHIRQLLSKARRNTLT
ncbi:hypothetical protein CDV36_000934 [Fusarium kuroshium]|uniref:Uncharacterized protein n=1 Tax=Fusarium kuroshium TaxID=2010991 RepID=A0A3M2SP67_9HYPO|nr:hypothetical protein CDV36_000934 [Fusarium kuroshium]